MGPSVQGALPPGVVCLVGLGAVAPSILDSFIWDRIGIGIGGCAPKPPCIPCGEADGVVCCALWVTLYRGLCPLTPLVSNACAGPRSFVSQARACNFIYN